MKTIRGKIMLTVLVVALLSLTILASVSIVNLIDLRDRVVVMSDELGTSAGEGSSVAMEEQVTEQLTQLAQSKADIADEKLGKQQQYVQMTADYLTTLYEKSDIYGAVAVDAPDPSLAGTLSAQLIYSPDIVETPEVVAEEVGLLGNSAETFLTILANDSDLDANYFSTVSGFTMMFDVNSDAKPDSVEARQKAWFLAASESESLIWTDVFEDSMGRGLSITCAAPFFDGEGGEVMGVVGFGSIMTTISDVVLDSQVGETGYVFVLNDQGQTIISPNMELDEDGSIIRANLLENESADVRALVTEMMGGASGVSRLDYNGTEVYMAYEPMEVLPWTVVTVIDVEEALAPATATRESIDALTATTVTEVDTVIFSVLLAIAIVFIVAIVIVLVGSALLANRITKPLSTLIHGVGQIGQGELDAQIQVETKDEIATLATAFNNMTTSLKHYITDLTAVTAEKERIGAELDVATDIQASMLPCIFPAFPEHKEFDIYASMMPAKEVGGDFYDFFLVDDDHLGIVMADVSGKGVPAALFMVIAKTLIKNHAQNGEAPDTTFTNVNNQLCETNEAGLFVTAWMAVLNVHTGELVFANAGHNPPLLKRREGTFEYLHSDPGFVLAGLEGMEYDSTTLTMGEGDILYLYTDGVTEAINVSEELFEEERLKNSLDKHHALPLGDMLHALKADLDAFVGEADQFDDITMLALKFGEH